MKTEIISKELLSAVLGEVDNISFHKDSSCEVRHGASFENYQQGCSYTYKYGNQATRFIPVHELAHVCILWAWDKMYEVTPRVMGAEIMCLKNGSTLHIIQREDIKNPEMFDPRFTIKACQWILDIKDKK